MKASLRSITPLIPSGGSLADALAFYTEHMGFSVVCLQFYQEEVG